MNRSDKRFNQIAGTEKRSVLTWNAIKASSSFQLMIGELEG